MSDDPKRYIEENLGHSKEVEEKLQSNCSHPYEDAQFLQESRAEEGDPLFVWRCGFCGAKYVQGL